MSIRPSFDVFCNECATWFHGGNDRDKAIDAALRRGWTVVGSVCTCVQCQIVQKAKANPWIYEGEDGA